jgi:acetyltransferase-like isoleucine patch superfamily enzyme
MRLSDTPRLVIRIYNILTNMILLEWYTNLMYLNLKALKISIGKQCKFNGFTKIISGKNNKIIIGSNCKFLSRPTSNLIGINRPCILSSIGLNASKLEIGDNCGFSGTVIGCFDSVVIGSGVRCGANTLITDSDWHLSDPRSSKPKAIIIEDNVWLGVNVIVLKGVTIGENSVIGAGSVVTKDIPSNVIAAGNPCKIIKHLNNL